MSLTVAGLLRASAAAAALAAATGCASTGVVRPSPFPGSISPAVRDAKPAPTPASPPVSDASASPAERPSALTTSATALTLPPASVLAAVQDALDQRGTSYSLGGESPSSGFDCSGLVQYVLARQGITLPRTVAEQVLAGRPVALDELQPGDLVFFITEGRTASHVGIVVDATSLVTFVHAPGSGGFVRTDRMSTPYWRDRFAGARRVW
jgi:cell wall-associated NlpC family hydrolase